MSGNYASFGNYADATNDDERPEAAVELEAEQDADAEATVLMGHTGIDG